MSENNESPPSTPLARLAKLSKPKQTTAPAPEPIDLTVEVRAATQRILDEANMTPVPSHAPEPPFPVGARVRYRGNYCCLTNHQYGAEFTIVATAGEYSMYVVDLYGEKYDLVISPATKSKWALV